MRTPDNKAGQLTEEIMYEIQQHIRREPPPQENHHYNRVYETIYRILNNLERKE